MRAMKNRPVFTRGRPKGETERRQQLQQQIHTDLAWLGCPYKPDLYSFLVKNLPDPEWRTEYQLTPPECPEVYNKSIGKRIGERYFRREIAFVHRKIWGGPKSRSLWQHWRHQNYRLTRIKEDTIVVDTGTCRKRGGARRRVKIAVTKRKCMICKKSFSSEGIQNRLCSKCSRQLPRYLS
jgi:hypothetical protein